MKMFLQDATLQPGQQGISAQILAGTKGLTLANLMSLSPPAKAALFTGSYIFIVGLLLLFAPLTCFTILFDQR